MITEHEHGNSFMTASIFTPKARKRPDSYRNVERTFRKDSCIKRF